MRPLKIIIFDGSFKTTPFINRLASGLAERHEVYIAGFNEDLSQRLNKVHYIALGSNQNKLRFLMTTLYWAWQQTSIKVLVKTIQALLKGDKSSIQQQNLAAALAYINPDIIHLQWTSVVPYFEFLLASGDIPVILSQRGFHTNVKPFVYPENRAYLQKWYPRFAGFHSVSQAILKNGARIWDHPKKIDRVVYTGLNLAGWVFSKSYTRSEPLKILSVGRNHWKKGYNYALQMCHLLKMQGLSFEYVIIGAEQEEELLFLRNDLNLEGEVRLLGNVPISEVKSYMENSSLLLMPSLEEGLPNVAVEAMALGLPVIAFDVGGISELIENGKTGWLAPVRDVDTMATLVMDFAAITDVAIEHVRAAARVKVERQHSEDGMVRGMEELYREVLGRFHAENAEFDAEVAEGRCVTERTQGVAQSTQRGNNSIN